jgi:hypothetical protein
MGEVPHHAEDDSPKCVGNKRAEREDGAAPIEVQGEIVPGEAAEGREGEGECCMLEGPVWREGGEEDGGEPGADGEWDG